MRAKRTIFDRFKYNVLFNKSLFANVRGRNEIFLIGFIYALETRYILISV